MLPPGIKGFSMKETRMQLFNQSSKSQLNLILIFSQFPLFIDLFCTVINLLHKRNEGNITAATESVNKVFYISLRRDLNIIFSFLSSINFLRILNYSQSFQEQVVNFLSVIILSEKKALNIAVYTWIYFNILVHMVYMVQILYSAPIHLFQLSRFEWEAPVSRRQLPLSCNSLNLPFWDDPGLDVRYLWIFQINHTF